MRYSDESRPEKQLFNKERDLMHFHGVRDSHLSRFTTLTSLQSRPAAVKKWKRFHVFAGLVSSCWNGVESSVGNFSGRLRNSAASVVNNFTGNHDTGVAAESRPNF